MHACSSYYKVGPQNKPLHTCSQMQQACETTAAHEAAILLASLHHHQSTHLHNNIAINAHTNCDTNPIKPIYVCLGREGMCSANHILAYVLTQIHWGEPEWNHSRVESGAEVSELLILLLFLLLLLLFCLFFCEYRECSPFAIFVLRILHWNKCL